MKSVLPYPQNQRQYKKRKVQFIIPMKTTVKIVHKSYFQIKSNYK